MKSRFFVWQQSLDMAKASSRYKITVNEIVVGEDGVTPIKDRYVDNAAFKDDDRYWFGLNGHGTRDRDWITRGLASERLVELTRCKAKRLLNRKDWPAP